MKNRLIALARKAIKPGDKNFRNHLYIFLICVLISLFIWFLIKMSDEYTADLSMPVEYGNVPAQKILVSADDKLFVRARANGGDIFSSRFLSGRRKLSIDLKEAELKKSRYFDQYYILSRELDGLIAEALGSSHEIVSISPDTLFFNFEEIISKQLPVRPAVSYSFKAQYQAYDSLAIEPAVVTVRGPASVIDTLGGISTVVENFRDLDRNLDAKVGLRLPFSDQRVTIDPEEVNLKMTVEKFTESTIDITVRGISTEAGSLVRTFPEIVQVTYRVALKDFKLVKPEMFEITAIYDPVRDKDKSFIRVNLEQSPKFTRVTRIQPEKVEFLIQQP